jgi:N-acyl-D-glutamate deacylase
MKERGRMQEGMAADIVIFDPNSVAERATYNAGENGLPPVGLPHVIVNGTFVKRDNAPTGALPGLPIRYPVESEGRHVPATTEQWLQEFTIDDGSLLQRE